MPTISVSLDNQCQTAGCLAQPFSLFLLLRFFLRFFTVQDPCEIYDWPRSHHVREWQENHPYYHSPTSKRRAWQPNTKIFLVLQIIT